MHLNISMREFVMLAGTLSAKGIEASCTIRVVKVSIPNLEIWEYVKAEVVDAPPSLPDGNYELSFEGRRMRATKSEGVWL